MLPVLQMKKTLSEEAPQGLLGSLKGSLKFYKFSGVLFIAFVWDLFLKKER